MPIYGNQSALGFVFQNSYGTVGDLTNSTTNLPYLSETLTRNQEDILSNQLDGVYDERSRYNGHRHVSGDIEVEAGAASLGLLLSAMMNKASSVTSDSIFTHIWQPNTSESMPLSWGNPVTISKGSSDANSNRQNFHNLCATSLEFSLEQGGFLKAKAAFVGGTDDNGVVDVSNQYISNDELFTWDNSSLTLNGAGLSAESITVNVADPIEPQFTLGQGFWPYANRLNGFRDVTFNMTIPWNNNSNYTDFFNDTNIGLLKLYCKGTTEIQSGYNNQIWIEVERARYETLEKSAGGPGEVMLNISGRGQYSDANANTLQITMINSQGGALYK